MTTVDRTTGTATTDLRDPGAQAGPRTPGATIEVRHVDPAGGVIITVAGVIGRNDTAALSTKLHTELDSGPTVMVVNLVEVESCDQAGREVLATAAERARVVGTTMHLVATDDLSAGDVPALVNDPRRVSEHRSSLAETTDDPYPQEGR